VAENVLSPIQRWESHPFLSTIRYHSSVAAHAYEDPEVQNFRLFVEPHTTLHFRHAFTGKLAAGGDIVAGITTSINRDLLEVGK